MSLDQPGRADTALGIGVEGVLALVGLPAFGVAAPVVARVSQSVRREHRQRASVALQAAQRVSGLSWVDLTERLSDDPTLQPLLVRVLYAAGMNGYDDTLRALGGALGDAVRQPDRARESELILQAIADLTADHVAVLRVVAGPPPVPDPDPAPARRPPWYSHTIAEAVDIPADVFSLVYAGVLARGLFEDVPYAMIGSNGGVGLSPVGRTVLDVIDAHAAESGAPLQHEGD